MDMDCHGLPLMATDCHGLPLMATDCHGLPQAEAHRRFEQSQHRDLKATFIYNLASAYDRIDRYKRLQEGEKAPRSASLQKGSSPRKATATPQSLVAGPSHAAPTPAPTA
jgi:hypothetical protein